MLSYEYETLKDDYSRLEWLETEIGVEIVSYGLAPSPSGYNYEITDEVRYSWHKQRNTFYLQELNRLCDIAERGYLNKIGL